MVCRSRGHAHALLAGRIVGRRRCSHRDGSGRLRNWESGSLCGPLIVQHAASDAASLAVPGTGVGAIRSAASRRTDGASDIAGAATAGASGIDCPAGGAATLRRCHAAGWLPGFRSPGGRADVTSKAPTATVAPSLATMSERIPLVGAGTSMVTLWLSSTSGSSTATASPDSL